MDAQRATLPRPGEASQLRLAQRFEVKLDEVPTIVSYKKLVREAEEKQAREQAPALEAPPGANPALEARLGSSAAGQVATKEGPLAGGGNADPLAPPPNRFSSVIEKIERLYKGQESDEENGDVPEEVDFDDQYDTDDSFIDDAELDAYFSAAQGRAKHSGFFINRGELEQVEASLEAQPQVKVIKKRKRQPKVSSNGEQAKVASDRKGLGPTKLKAGNKAAGKGLGRGAPGVPRKKKLKTAVNGPAQQTDRHHETAVLASERVMQPGNTAQLPAPAPSRDAEGASTAVRLGLAPTMPALLHPKKTGLLSRASESAGRGRHAETGANVAMPSGHGGGFIAAGQSNIKMGTAALALQQGASLAAQKVAGNESNPAGPLEAGVPAPAGGKPSGSSQAAAQKRKQGMAELSAPKKLKMEARQAGDGGKGLTGKPSSSMEKAPAATGLQETVSSRKPGVTKTLEKAVADLQSLVATIPVPAVEEASRDATDQGNSQPPSRMPRMSTAVKEKLGRVARLAARNEEGKIPPDMVERLTEMMKPLMQPINLKKHLKSMVEKGNDAQKQREQELENGKTSLGERVKVLVAQIQAEGGPPPEVKPPTEDASPCGEKPGGATNGLFKWDAATEDHLGQVFDQYVKGLDERSGQQYKRLYAELAALWPKGWMDPPGIKETITRVKKRQQKDKPQVKLKKKAPPPARQGSKSEGGDGSGHGSPEGSTATQPGRGRKGGLNRPEPKKLLMKPAKKVLLIRPAKKTRKRPLGQWEGGNKAKASGQQEDSLAEGQPTSLTDRNEEEIQASLGQLDGEQSLQGASAAVLMPT